jgi:hypothetical protein
MFLASPDLEQLLTQAKKELRQSSIELFAFGNRSGDTPEPLWV